MNKLTSKVANEAVQEIDALTAKIDIVLGERERVAAALKEMPGVSKVYPSDTNFILFQCKNAQAVYKDMADSGIVIRFRGTQQHCDSCNRVTVGTKVSFLFTIPLDDLYYCTLFMRYFILLPCVWCLLGCCPLESSW
jgi:histidinol-phosphate/aromatic aminotransferase/cobyric acid decarboxylase-like protein